MMNLLRKLFGIKDKPELHKDQLPDFKTGVQEKGFKKGSLEWYRWAWDACKFDNGYEDQIRAAANRVLRGKAAYQSVELKIGVPWYMVGAIHHMESSCDMRGVLHNGERILNTGKKTKLVPRGRGPFNSWEEAAIDALRLQGLHLLKKWPIEMILKQAEAYNGLGYIKWHPSEASPYLWAQTSINDGRGKYVADGKWNANADANAQVGFAAILKQLELSGVIRVERI